MGGLKKLGYRFQKYLAEMSKTTTNKSALISALTLLDSKRVIIAAVLSKNLQFMSKTRARNFITEKPSIHSVVVGQTVKTNKQ